MGQFQCGVAMLSKEDEIIRANFWGIALDPDTTPSVKVQALNSLVKLSETDKLEGTSDVNDGNTYVINPVKVKAIELRAELVDSGVPNGRKPDRLIEGGIQVNSLLASTAKADKPEHVSNIALPAPKIDGRSREARLAREVAKINA